MGATLDLCAGGGDHLHDCCPRAPWDPPPPWARPRSAPTAHHERPGTVLAPRSWLPSVGCADGVAVSSVVSGPGDDLHDGPKDEPRLIVLDEVTGLTSDDEAPLGREL